MLQFNLLPDVKINYIQARRQKRLVMFVSTIVGLSSLGVLTLVLLYVFAVQGALLASVQSKIDTSIGSIDTKNSEVDDINKVLTVQNQLNALDTLHADKPVTSRIFDYLSKLTPSQVTISRVALQYGDEKTINLQGSTDTIETINRFVDTLKFSTFTPPGEGADPQPVFTNVVLTSFGRDKQGASYGITFEYDPVIFDVDTKVEGLLVPQKTTTRSELGRPIFQTQNEANNNAPDPVEGEQP